MYKIIIILATIFITAPVKAHETHQHINPSYLTHINTRSTDVSMTIEGSDRIMIANGLPNHQTGQFPGRGNPHAISSQDYEFIMPAQPRLSEDVKAVSNKMFFGVALNGVPFDPGTAEYWKNDRHSGWVEEGIVNGKKMLGIDMNNAHVQPNGAYHYHGIPNDLVDEDLSHIGYAADGFKIYVSKKNAYKSGYRLKTGKRPKNSPGGRYDGTYTQDFRFVVGQGDLDQCNGTKINGSYAYVLTQEFPYVPRCWRGFPNESFMKQVPGEGEEGRRGGPPRGEHPPHHRGDRPPPRRF